MSRSSLVRSCVLAAAAVAIAAGGCARGDDAPSGTPTTAAPGTTAAESPGATNTTTPATTTTATQSVRLVEVAYAGGQVAGGAQRTTVRVGEKVRIRVTSDVADEVHVHTYDLRAAVGPGQPGEVELVASIPGRHEVELEKKRRQLLVLEVR